MSDAPAADRIRADKWLWQARFFKTRSLAAKQVSGGHVRLNGARILKPATQLKPGDTLTFLQGQRTRIVRLEAIGTRRGPAPEAQTLFTDMSPVQEKRPPAPAYEGKGRPTKKQRRHIDLSRRQALESDDGVN